MYCNNKGYQPKLNGINPVITYLQRLPPIFIPWGQIFISLIEFISFSCILFINFFTFIKKLQAIYYSWQLKGEKWQVIICKLTKVLRESRWGPVLVNLSWKYLLYRLCFAHHPTLCHSGWQWWHQTVSWIHQGCSQSLNQRKFHHPSMLAHRWWYWHL